MLALEDRMDALHQAADAGNMEVVQSLLSLGTDPNLRSGDLAETPLMYAAWRGRVAVARLLLASGAGADLTTAEGWSALHSACSGKHPEVVELLLAHEANPNGYSHHRSFDEQLGWSFSGTPLHVCAANGGVEVAEQLLVKGVSVEEAWQEDRRTPIFYAAAYGRAEMVALLCKHGANPNAREHRHENDLFFDATPLHYAAGNGHAEAVRVLLSCGAEHRAVESYSVRTALQMARAARHATVVKLLREHRK